MQKLNFNNLKLSLINLALVSLFLNFLVIANKLEFVIIVPSYNNEKYYFRNLDSIVNQKTKSKFKVIYINDCSTDRTGELVEAYVKNYNLKNKVKIINNSKNMGVLANIYNAVHSCEDHKIVFVVDGDDCLANDKVISRLKKEYKDPNIWMTYGQFIWYPAGILGVCEEIPEIIKKNNNFRQYKWVSSQLRTFRAKLFKKIKKEDLLYNNSFYKMAGDVAFIMPLLEMASKNHIKFIPDILYLYNYRNPISDHNVNRLNQYDLDLHIRLQKPYEPLNFL